MPFAIDYAAARDAIYEAVRTATGLGQNQVVSAQPEEAGAIVPQMPFITVQFLSASRLGMPWHEANVLDTPSSLEVSFNCFAETHEECLGIMEQWRAALYTASARSTLHKAGLAFWDAEALRDLSEPIDTGYQPRAYLAATFGITSRVDDDRGEIDTASVNGQIIAPRATTPTPTGSSGASTVVALPCKSTDAVGAFVSGAPSGGVQTADSGGLETMPVLGVIVGKSDDQTAEIQTSGLTPDGILTGLRPGTNYFASASGGIAPAPVTNVPVLQFIGVAVSATQLLLCISPNLVVRDV